LSAKKPRIGITTGSAKSWLTKDFIPYSEAVKRAGGEPVLIRANEASLVGTCQGLLFSGGRDIHPSLYSRRAADVGLSDDEMTTRFKLEIDDARDAYELPLACRALSDGLAVFGICRGMQVLNVAAGGSLVPDIALGISSSVLHRSGTEGSPAVHPFRFEPGARFAEIVGGRSDVLNSYHHQGVTDAELAPAFRASAYAEDGIIEALEHPSYPFCVAVQFHPEKDDASEVLERFAVLFSAFVSAARRA